MKSNLAYLDHWRADHPYEKTTHIYENKTTTTTMIGDAFSHQELEFSLVEGIEYQYVSPNFGASFLFMRRHKTECVNKSIQ